jgi:hypothetical protein
VGALQNNTVGNNNASGYSALYSNKTGNYNTGSGVEALGSNTSGVQNTAVGGVALENNNGQLQHRPAAALRNSRFPINGSIGARSMRIVQSFDQFLN